MVVTRIVVDVVTTPRAMVPIVLAEAVVEETLVMITAKGMVSVNPLVPEEVQGMGRCVQGYLLVVEVVVIEKSNYR